MYIRKNVVSMIIIIFLLVIGISFSANAIEEEVNLEGKRILFISSYSPSFNTFFNQVEGLKSVLEPTEATFDIEFMDTKRFYAEKNIQNFYNSLKYKIEHSKKYDLIIVGDDNALDFVVKYDELFPDQPIVFLGINDVEKAKKIAENSNITGIYESVSLEGTIRLAQIIMPNAKKVIALVDTTETGQSVKDMYIKINSFENELILETIDLKDLTFSQYEEKLREISSDDIVLLVAVHRDRKGETFTFEEGVDITLRNIEQPVFGLYDFVIGSGLLGGDVISFYDQGSVAGNVAKNVLSGEKIESIKIIENTTIKMLDYSLFEKYNLQDKKLPKDLLYINREENIFLKVFPYIVAVLLIILFEGALIFYLINNIKKRKNAEKNLLRKKEELLNSNEELIAMNEETKMSNAELFSAVQKIEEQKQEIMNLIYLDTLTNLKNRRAINELIREWLQETDDEFVYYIMFLDVDNFKLINDTFGHDFGDKVIIETGSRLETLETDSLKIGRFGGDEFLIIYKDRDMNHFSEFINKIEQLFKTPFVIENNMLFLTVSIGVSIYPIHGMFETELIKKADMALYKAKEAGKNRAVIYNQKMIEEVEDKVLFQSFIRRDFYNEKFYMNYQPLYDVKKERFIGAEALIRWKNTEIGQVSPIKLIKASEEMGLIVEIGKWILKEACTFAKYINQESEDDIMISINISSVQMMHPDFIKDFTNIVQEIGVQPKHICLEMTETILFEFPDENEHIIEKLKAMGVCIALDDFGTGYSSLSYFKNIPATVLKIDKEFIDNLGKNKLDQYTVEMIIHLAHYNNLIVVAEGVEELEQLEILRELKCDLIQGYYYSKPLSQIEVRKLLLEKK